MLQFPEFQRKFGVHRADMVLSPRKFLLTQFNAPQNSMFHYIGTDPMEDGPSENWQMLAGITKSQQISILHQTELTQLKGGARFLGIAVDNTISSWHQQNKRFLRVRTFKNMPTSTKGAGILNYCFIARRYKYDVSTIQTEYAKVTNLFATVLEGVRTAAMNSQRDNYLIVDLPEVFPAVNTLNQAAAMEGNLSNDLIKRLGGAGGYIFLELWKWLTTNRSRSMFSSIGFEVMSKVNIIFTYRGRWCFVNLAFLNRIRQTPESEAVTEDQRVARGMVPLLLAKSLLRGLTTLSAGLVDNPEGDDNQIVDDDEDEEEEFSFDAQRANEVKNTTDEKGKPVALSQLPSVIAPKEKEKPKAQTVRQVVQRDFNVNDPMAGMDEASFIDLEKALDKELTGLDTITDVKDKRETQDVDGVVTEQELLPETADTPEDQLVARAIDMATTGQISAAELRRFERLSTNYKDKIVMANGQSLAEFMVPTEAEITVVEKPRKQVDGIVNQEVTGSTIRDYDKQYVKNVLHRNISAMIVNLQKGGVAVQDVKRETIKDPLGNYDIYKIRIVPLRGQPTTWELRFPEVDRNGSYMVNGVKYKHRKQIGQHMPIAKITPSRVALTSYYGKLFIDRALRRSNDYGSWLANAIRLKSSEENSEIYSLESMDVSNEKNDVPRVYSILSQSFSAFKVRRATEPRLEYQFNFIYANREKVFGKEVIQRYEKNGSVVVAVVNNGWIILDKDDKLHIAINGKSQELGSIESFLSLDYSKAPAEIADMGIMGKEIPVGILLGYRMGIDRLIAFLRAFVRKVPAGQHLKLEPNEYAVRFADQSFIFDKSDKKATLILAGFTRFSKQTINYTAHDFNDPGVYMNLLEESDIPARMLIEHDNHYSMFIDPITKHLLNVMKEPETFQPLMLRAVELLLTDYTPEVKNRMRGYERFAGMAYTQMVDALRAHNNRPNAESRKVDLHPYAVWQAIVEDSAKIIESNINPIEDLKQIEAVTYTGTGGRSMRSLVKSTRKYHEYEQGLIGDGTVDNGTVGANAYLCANPKLTSVYGTYEEWDKNKDDPSRLVSTSMLLSPGADTEDTLKCHCIKMKPTLLILC